MVMDFANTVRDDDGDVQFEVNDVYDEGTAREYLEGFDSSGSVAALVTGPYNFEFETPIWMPCDTAYELHEAGIIDMTSQQSTQFLGNTVYLYETS